MTKLENNFREKYTENNCSRCLQEPDNEKLLQLLVHKSAHYIKSIKLKIIMKNLTMNILHRG